MREQNIRLRAYFVTLCAQDQRHLFGRVVDHKMILSPAGDMIFNEWQSLQTKDNHITVDEFIVMPNHFHGIIFIGSNYFDVGHFDRVGVGGQAQGLPVRGSVSLPDLIRRFKSSTTVQYIRGVKERGWPPFRKRLWLRNYYERIIRNDKELKNVREYIHNNPKNWDSDPENTD